MRTADFFREEEQPGWDLTGLDPWMQMRTVLDTELIDELRAGPLESAADVDAAYALAQLAHEELVAYGTGGGERLSDDEMAGMIRGLRSVLKRNHLDFDPPFRDFKGFRGYWSSNGMSGDGGWAARRGYLSDLFGPVFSGLDTLEGAAGVGSLKTADGQLRNLIFASVGQKPEIVLRDAISNVIEVTRHAGNCLFYDRPLTTAGLTWGELTDWWKEIAELTGKDDLEVSHRLYTRLGDSVRHNRVEHLVFRTYCERYASPDARELPALLPQVYLHFDPLTRKQREGRHSVLARERMDFLLLLPNAARIVLEVDGKQHYADGDKASTQLYSEMTAEDRRLRLRGYEVYRFGGFELSQPRAPATLRTFFDDLFEKHLTY